MIYQYYKLIALMSLLFFAFDLKYFGLDEYSAITNWPQADKTSNPLEN